MNLKNYQIIAVKKLLTRSKELLEQSGEKKIIFKAPTGSGKTIMAAEFLKQLVEDKSIETKLSFIWTAPRKLHSQSKRKLEKYFEDSRVIDCADFEELVDRQISENQILFLNWESINKRDKNTIVKENEKEFYLGKIIEMTKSEGREIILIIDESHHHATSEISQELISDINPKLTVEVSATPVIINPDEIVTVTLEEVKIEGMIKKSVILNADFQNILNGENLETALSSGTDGMVLEEALKKRRELSNAYRGAGIKVNPLILIQLPDRKTSQEDLIKEEVQRLLRDNHGISIGNGKLAVYLSEEKVNLENISMNDNETEVLIFKQAIALGWDCPRAQILVLFRDWKSLIFSVQTVGRIMRMPEPEFGHYKQDNLNHGYVYTNLGSIEIKEDIARNYVTVYSSKRISTYEFIRLDSVYRLRQREKTRLNPLFVKIFLKVAQEYRLDKKIDIGEQKLEIALITDYEAASVDKLVNQDIKGERKIDTKNETDLQKLFDYFVRNNLSPLYPEDRSINRVKEAIYFFFKAYLKLFYTESFSEIIHIILSKGNIQHFVNVIDISKEKYLHETKKRENELQKVKDWEIPEIINFGGDFRELNVEKSVLKPFYYDFRWKTEQAFIKFLERSTNIKWWFKNGERDSTFFAVPYNEDGEIKPFYVDFIVLFNNGQYGFYDTKSGRLIKDAKEKSDGLQEYLIEQNKNGRNFIGGIVTNTDSINFSGRWIYYNGKGEDLKIGDFSNWQLFEI